MTIKKLELNEKKDGMQVGLVIDGINLSSNMASWIAQDLGGGNAKVTIWLHGIDIGPRLKERMTEYVSEGG